MSRLGGAGGPVIHIQASAATPATPDASATRRRAGVRRQAAATSCPRSCDRPPSHHSAIARHASTAYAAMTDSGVGRATLTREPGTSAKYRARSSSQPTSAPVTWPSGEAIAGAPTIPSATWTIPSHMIGATSGSPARFARTLTADTAPKW